MKAPGKNTIQLIYTLLIAFLFQSISFSQVLFTEGFETGELPQNWSEEFVNGSVNWFYQNGGHSEYPAAAHTGSYNAIYQYQSLSNEATKLITPSQDFVTIERIKLELRFWHTQDDWYENNDILSVYYKKGIDSSWILLETYTEPVISWTERKIQLPDTSYTADYYIAFEATTKWGHGVCIDDVEIVETGIIHRYIDTILVENVTNDFVATGTNNNPVLKIDIEVQGNTDDMILDSLSVKSLNSNDNDLKDNGVKVYYTTKNEFSTENQLGSSVDFQNSTAIFSNLNKLLPTGNNYLWVTFDIDSAANHGGYIDAQISAEAIKINDEVYPSISRSPGGKRVIYETIFFDDFEGLSNWTLTGEFEIDTTTGNGGSPGNPDPDKALSGTKLLGTDLTGLGSFLYKYEPNLTEKAYQAMSPEFNTTYYKDIVLSFYRWLNIDLWDKANIEYSADSGKTWIDIWESDDYILDNSWSKFSYAVPDVRSENLFFRYSLGNSNIFNNYSGWNIDDFLLTGDFIANDVGVNRWIAPLGGCGHTENDSVTVEITNYSGRATNDTIPLYFSFDGGDTKTKDTLFQSLAIGESTTYTFKHTIDLSSPGNYDIVAATLLYNDEDNSNNAFDSSIFVIPTLPLPYSEDFEGDESYWASGGIKSTWEEGEPNGLFVGTAASGSNAWVTSLSSIHNNNEKSYAESPCFDFSGIENPIFELKNYRHLEDNSDGAYLMYSIDCGNEWKNAGAFGEQYDDIWNWYNSDSIGEPGFDGWTGNNFSWTISRKLLPQEIVGQTCVKFRIMFESDSVNRNEGFAFDDVKIYEAPLDIGAINITSPLPACELSNEENVTIRIQNLGLDTLDSGTEIIVGLKINDELEIKDTFNLVTELLVGDSVEYTIQETVDLFKANNYIVKAYTLLPEDYSIYDSINNDTATTNILVYGLPEYTLGPDIGSRFPDTLDLDAGDNLATYSWMDGAVTTRIYNVPSAGTYWVDVSNDSGCVANDTIEIILSDADLGITQVYNLNSACEINTDVFPQIEMKNYGPDSLFITDTFKVAYKINGQNTFIDTIVPTSTIVPDSAFDHTFTKGANISTPGDYLFEIYTVYRGDIDLSNDTLNKSIEVYGYPEVELGEDSIFTVQPDTVILDAGAGFDTYTWSDASDQQTFSIPVLTSSLYKVTVTDIHGCGQDSDSVQIIAYDIELKELVDPVSTCELSENQDIIAKLVNICSDTLPSGLTFNLRVIVESDTVENNFNLAADLIPGDSVNYTFDTQFDLSNIGSYDISVSYQWEFDVNNSNDHIDEVIKVYSYPVFDLGPDTIFTSSPDTIELTTVYGYDIYEWQDGSSDENYEITSPTSATYHVKVEDNHGCWSADTLQIISYDIGAIGLNAPGNSCELTSSEQIKVMVQNYCSDTLLTGHMVKVGYEYASQPAVIENHVLTDSVFPGEYFIHTFSTTEDFSGLGKHNIEFYTLSSLDVVSNNDTLTKNVEAWGYPDVDLEFDTIFTTQPDTIVLNAGPGYGSYLWQDGTELQTLQVTNPATSYYKVTITDKHNCGSAKDSTLVMTYNIGVSDFIDPDTSCALSASENVVLAIRNLGNDMLPTGLPISITYKVDNTVITGKTHNLSQPLMPDSIETVAFSEEFDMSDTDSYNLSAVATFSLDVDKTDTLNRTIKVYGYPVIELGNDIYTKQPDTITLNPGGGYYSYLWNDGSSNSTYTISSLQSKTYKVDVFNDAGCKSSDSIKIISTDLGIFSIVSPSNSCKLSANEPISFYVKNNSYDTLQVGDSIKISYHVDLVSKSETLPIPEKLIPNDTILVISSQTFNLDEVGSHDIQVLTDISYDVLHDNDTSWKQITVHGLPDVDIGADTIFTSKADTIKLTVNKDFEEYLWQDNSTSNSFEVEDKEAATYAVTVTDDNECKNSDSVLIISYDLRVKDILLNDTCELASNETISFIIENIGSATITANESFPANVTVNSNNFNASVSLNSELSSGASQTINFPEKINLKNKGDYDIMVEIKEEYDYNEDNDSYSKDIEVFGYPVVDFGTGGDKNITVKLPYRLKPNGSFEAYEWHDGKTTSYYDVKATGWHGVTVTDENNCSAEDKIYIIVDDPDNIDDYKNNLNIIVYPNPTQHKIHIRTSDNIEQYYAELFDLTGKAIFKKQINTLDNKSEISLAGYSSGIYYLVITHNKYRKRLKIVIGSNLAK